MQLSSFISSTSIGSYICMKEHEEKMKIKASIIKSFKVVTYNQTDFPECCPICLDPYTQKTEVKVLPCQHSFHPACISQWLMQHVRCPLCKVNVLQKHN